jgi:hypothetical protein
VPWHWDTHVRIALAPGIACYEAGKEYEHGGLSPQECVVPVLTVGRGAVAQPVTIETATWCSLRCSVQLRGATAGMRVDIRTKPGTSATSIVSSPKEPAADGTVSLMVADEDLLETAAYVVVLAADGTVQMQRITSVGGEQ